MIHGGQKSKTENGSLIQETFYVSDGGIGCSPMTFLVDTGANVSLMSQKSYKERFGHIPLQKGGQSINAFDGRSVKVLGTFKAKVVFGTRTHVDTFYVIAGQTRDLLGDNFLKPLGVTINCRDHTVSVVTASV